MNAEEKFWEALRRLSSALETFRKMGFKIEEANIGQEVFNDNRKVAGVDNYILKNGLYLFRVSDNVMKLDVPENFKPRSINVLPR